MGSNAEILKQKTANTKMIDAKDAPFCPA